MVWTMLHTRPVSRCMDEDLVDMRHEIGPRLLRHRHGHCLHSPILVVKEPPSNRDVHIRGVASSWREPKIIFENIHSALLGVSIA